MNYCPDGTEHSAEAPSELPAAGFHPQMSRQQITAMSALALAHIGDAVYELLVRTKLCVQGGKNNHRLHRDTVALVCADAQAAAAGRILPLLSEQELAIFRRGRNAHPHSSPKNATAVQYAKATGLEALFGALYLSGELARIDTLFAAATEEPQNAL